MTAFLALLKAGWTWLVKNPLLATIIVLIVLLTAVNAKYAWDRNSWKAERADVAIDKAAFKSSIANLTADLKASQDAQEGANRTIAIQKDELEKRDREDAARQKLQAQQVEKARAAAASAERVAQNAIRQLEAASRRSPTCAALLNSDIRKECGL